MLASVQDEAAGLLKLQGRVASSHSAKLLTIDCLIDDVHIPELQLDHAQLLASYVNFFVDEGALRVDVPAKRFCLRFGTATAGHDTASLAAMLQFYWLAAYRVAVSVVPVLRAAIEVAEHAALTTEATQQHVAHIVAAVQRALGHASQICDGTVPVLADTALASVLSTASRHEAWLPSTASSGTHDAAALVH